MKKFSLFLGFLLLISTFGKAQYTTHPMLSIGYTYQNQNFGEVGGKLLFIKQDNIGFRLGGSALLGVSHGKFAVMPKLQTDILLNFQENKTLSHGFYYIVGAETTTKYISPHLGISILGIFDILGGYSFSYPQQTLHGKTLKGLKIGVSLNVPFSVFQK